MLVSEAGIAAQLNNSKQSERKMPLTSLFLGGSSLAAKRAVEQAQLGVGLIPWKLWVAGPVSRLEAPCGTGLRGVSRGWLLPSLSA